jgi:homoserine/homoserine lactone efflux protein
MARGFALQVANPKALIFFVALLPQFLDVSRPIASQMAILGVTSVVIEFVVLAGYGYLAARALRLARQPRFVALTNQVSGGMLILAGTGIALSGELDA